MSMTSLYIVSVSHIHEIYCIDERKFLPALCQLHVYAVYNHIILKLKISQGSFRI